MHWCIGQIISIVLHYDSSLLLIIFATLVLEIKFYSEQIFLQQTAQKLAIIIKNKNNKKNNCNKIKNKSINNNDINNNNIKKQKW